MRHQKNKRKFGRPTKQRLALLRSLARSLILRSKIVSTEAKAKELRPFIEKLITKARENTLSSRRVLISRLNDKEAAKILSLEVAPKYKDRKGGYTRITKLPSRQSDDSRQAIIEFV